MWEHHRQSGTAATVGVVRLTEEAWHMERVQSDAEGRIGAIHRIHPLQERRSTLWPVGLYLFEPSVLDLIPSDKYFDLKEQLPAQLQEKGKPARVWEIAGYCRLVNSINDYVKANEDVLLGRVQFALEDRAGFKESSVASPKNISPGALVKDPVAVSPSARIEAGAMVIGPAAVGENCHIGAQAVISECIIFPGARVGQAAYLSHCIIGEGVEIGNSVCLHETMVLGDAAGWEKEMRADFGLERSGGAERIRTIRMPQVGGNQFYRLIKRAIDIVVSSLALSILSPLLLLIAMAVKIDSPGPVLFSQRRCGLWGKEFNMYKFRSMVVNAEELKTELMNINEVDGPMFKIISDPRVTRVGRFLRATNLDELPQFWNVLLGDISLVGPRPLAMEEMRLNPQWRDTRLSVPPGITGYWQIEAHDKVHFAEWIRCDIDYVRNFSFWLDMKIIIRTICKFFPGLSKRANGIHSAA
jgi:lipopolysaccharide/colanic/teichoic acid biosynthesis glycosyltransferase/acetyltransferase-like isoleucine patch superfamily enzyme